MFMVISENLADVWRYVMFSEGRGSRECRGKAREMGGEADRRGKSPSAFARTLA